MSGPALERAAARETARAPASAPGTPSATRRDDIQGLRALAVLLVVVFHAGLSLPGGFTGVDVFFTISGYVITRMLLAELRETDRLDLPRFYGRRVKRLLPALAVMVGVVALAAVVVSPIEVQTLVAKSGITAVLFSANAYLFRVTDTYFSAVTQLNPLLHTWTLAVEEQFYLLFPAVLLVAWRFAARRGRRRVGLAAAAIGAVSVVSFALSVLPRWGPFTPPRSFVFYASPTRAWEFGLGALLALAPLGAARVRRPVAEALGIAGLALIVVGATTLGEADVPGPLTLLPTGGTALVIAAGTFAAVSTSRLLSLRPARWIGDRSYSWYLWHWPFIVGARALFPGAGWAAPTAAALSLAPAWASYRYVENPLRHSPWFHGRRIVVGAAACVAVPAALCVALVASHGVLVGQPALAAAARSQTLHLDYYHRCVDSPVPLAARLSSSCAWNVRRPRGVVVLTGDSNAGHFTEPVVAAGNRAGFDVVVATTTGCPFVLLRVYHSTHTPSYCLDVVRRTLASLVSLRPALVVTADRTDGYIEDRSVSLGSSAGGRASFDPRVKAALWAHGLRPVLARLGAARIHVLLVHPIPKNPAATLGTCAVIRVLFGGCVESVARKTADSELRAAVAAEDAAAAHVPGTTAISLESALCDPRRCYARRDGVDVYRDPYHLSPAGASLLSGRFYEAIRRATRAAVPARNAKELGVATRTGEVARPPSVGAHAYAVQPARNPPFGRYEDPTTSPS
jgi:peptidoglycan/LPS O-acetylase OafA/YrhL